MVMTRNFDTNIKSSGLEVRHLFPQKEGLEQELNISSPKTGADQRARDEKYQHHVDAQKGDLPEDCYERLNRES